MINADHSIVLLFLRPTCKCFFFYFHLPWYLRGRAGKNRKKRLRPKWKGQAAMSEERTDCGLDLERREPSASGAGGLGPGAGE